MQPRRIGGRSWLILVVLCGTAARGQVAVERSEPGSGKESRPNSDAVDLAKKTQNPVSDLISVPFENQFGFGAGADGEFAYSLLIKPVFPQALNERWNWVHRAIIPVLDQPNVGLRGLGDECGLGDIQYQGYLSPRTESPWIWGVGPVLEFPTATDEALGSEKWSAGAGAVLLRIDGPWVAGVLVNNIWSFAGDGDRKSVNRMTIQPFVNYNFDNGFYLVSSPLITADWSADSDQAWTVPIGGGVGKIIQLGELPVNLTLQAYYNVERSDFAPDWTVRFQASLLFPKG